MQPATFLFADSPGIDTYWNECLAARQPHIVIRQERGKSSGFATIEYDLLPCKIVGLELKRDLLDAIRPIYESYAAFFVLPEKEQALIGGSIALSIRVFATHAELIAGQLADYLKHFLLENRVTGEQEFCEASEHVLQGQNLRTSLDPHCAEFELSTTQTKKNQLRSLVKAGGFFVRVVRAYAHSYFEAQPYVVSDLKAGLLANIRIWQTEHPDDDDFRLSTLQQMDELELTEILEDKVRRNLSQE